MLSLSSSLFSSPLAPITRRYHFREPFESIISICQSPATLNRFGRVRGSARARARSVSPSRGHVEATNLVRDRAGSAALLYGYSLPGARFFVPGPPCRRRRSIRAHACTLARSRGTVFRLCSRTGELTGVPFPSYSAFPSSPSVLRLFSPVADTATRGGDEEARFRDVRTKARDEASVVECRRSNARTVENMGETSKRARASCKYDT